MEGMDRRAAFGRLFAFLANPASARKESRPPRPPYGTEEALFQKRCPECPAPCIAACEEGIIALDGGKTPVLNLSKAGCTFCEKCADACPATVLDKERGTCTVAGTITLEKRSCLSWNRTICYSCKEACPEKAISLTGMFQAAIAPNLCTRCGWCVGVCPVHAITLKGEPCQNSC